MSLPVVPLDPMLPEDLVVVRRYLYAMANGDADVRALHATAMSYLRRESFPALVEPPSAAAASAAAQLTAEGVVPLGQVVDPARCAEMLAYFRAKPVYAGHVHRHSDGVLRSLDETRAMSHYGAHSRADVVRCPHLVEIANDPHLLQIAEQYLGCPPTIYSLHAWWSFPRGGTAAEYSQTLHRDLDELRFVTMFIYLTPVGEQNGAHRYIRFSHDKPTLTRTLSARGWSESHVRTALTALFAGHGYQMAETADALVSDLAMLWTGPAGSALMADTYGLHMGLPMREGERLMLWVRYGLGLMAEPEMAGLGDYAPTLRGRIPATPRARYINRVLLAE